MTDDQTIISRRVELAPGLVGDWDIVEGNAGFEGEYGDDGSGLVDDGGKEVGVEVRAGRGGLRRSCEHFPTSQRALIGYEEQIESNYFGEN